MLKATKSLEHPWRDEQRLERPEERLCGRAAQPARQARSTDRQPTAFRERPTDRRAQERCEERLERQPFAGIPHVCGTIVEFTRRFGIPLWRHKPCACRPRCPRALKGQGYVQAQIDLAEAARRGPRRQATAMCSQLK